MVWSITEVSGVASALSCRKKMELMLTDEASVMEMGTADALGYDTRNWRTKTVDLCVFLAKYQEGKRSSDISILNY